MMAVRWKVINFNQQIPPDQHKEVTPCGHCFAELFLTTGNKWLFVSLLRFAPSHFCVNAFHL